MDWLLDGLVQFLTSPIWKCNIEDFVDQNCLIFDAGEENKFTYTDVHIEYKATVERLLDTYFLQELNMTFTQLMSACSDGFAKNSQFKDLFQPLLAVDDFLLFKSIMVQNNIRLNKEAEKALEQEKAAHHYKNQDQEQQSKLNKRKEESNQGVPAQGEVSSGTQNDDELLAQVLLQSRIEYERKVSAEEKEFETLLRRATEESLKCYEMELKVKSLKSPPSDSNTNAAAIPQTSTDSLAVLPSLDIDTATPKSDFTAPDVNPSIANTQLIDNSTDSNSSSETLLSDIATLPITPSDLHDKGSTKSNGPTVSPHQHMTMATTPSTVASGPSIKGKGPKISDSGQDSAILWLASARAETTAAQQGTQVVHDCSTSEKSTNLRTREEYLKATRDSIIAKKRKERDSELQDYLKANPQYTTEKATSSSTTAATSKQKSKQSLDNPQPLEEGKKNEKSWRKRLKQKKPVLTPDVADKIK